MSKMKNMTICLVFIFLFCSCHSSKKQIPGMRGEESLIVMLLPEPLFADNDLVDDVMQQLTDKSVECGINLRFFEPGFNEYDNMLNEILSLNYPEEGDALLITIDNSMQLSLYETNALGRFHLCEHHRIEFYGVGYLSGLCVGLMDYSTLILQSENMQADNLRFGDGFRAGFDRMHPDSDLEIRFGEMSDINQLYQYADDFGWDLIVTNNGIAEPWNGQVYFDYDIEYGYGRLVHEYLGTWMKYKPRTKVPDEVISLKSGYIDFSLNNKSLFGELIEIHWPEAVEFEEQYVSSFIPVE